MLLYAPSRLWPAPTVRALWGGSIGHIPHVSVGRERRDPGDRPVARASDDNTTTTTTNAKPKTPTQPAGILYRELCSVTTTHPSSLVLCRFSLQCLAVVLALVRYFCSRRRRTHKSAAACAQGNSTILEKLHHICKMTPSAQASVHSLLRCIYCMHTCLLAVSLPFLPWSSPCVVPPAPCFDLFKGTHQPPPFLSPQPCALLLLRHGPQYNRDIEVRQ